MPGGARATFVKILDARVHNKEERIRFGSIRLVFCLTARLPDEYG
jgi:hypothetical protein